MADDETKDDKSNRFGKKVSAAVCPNCGHEDVSYTGFYYTCEKCLYKSDNRDEWIPSETDKSSRQWWEVFTPSSLWLIPILFILLAGFVYGTYVQFIPSNLSSSIASSLLVLVTASYVIMTWKLVEETRNARKQEVLPLLKIDTEPFTFSSHGLKIVNSGNGLAHNIDLQLTLVLRGEEPERQISRTISSLSAGDFVGFYSPFEEVDLNEKIHEKYEKLVLMGQCEDVFGELHTIEDDYDLSLLETREQSSMFKTEKGYLKDIVKELKDISDSM